MHTTFCSSIHLPVAAGRFPPFGCCNNAALNKAYAYLPESLLSPLLGPCLEVELLEPLFNFPRTWHTVFHNGCPVLRSHQSSGSPHACPHQSLDVLSRCGLICIPLMTSEVEHLFMCLLSLEKCLVKSFACFCDFLFCYFFVVVGL